MNAAAAFGWLLMNLAGLMVITMSLVEEIVGEIEDEHDMYAPRFDRKSDGTAIADARLEIDMLEAITGPLLDDERDEVDTIGGLSSALPAGAGHSEVVRHEVV